MTNGTTHDRACPGDELLVAYLTEGLSGAERGRLDAHLRDCDYCLTTVAMVQRRLSIAAEVPAPVPAGVTARVRAAGLAVAHASPPAVASARATVRPTVVERLASVVRRPLLIPAAIAAAVVVIMVTQQPSPSPSGLTRGVAPLHERLRVTGREVPVYAQPTSRAEVVATVSHGATVTVRGEEREWYRVVLPDGKEGWVDREAFE